MKKQKATFSKGKTAKRTKKDSDEDNFDSNLSSSLEYEDSIDNVASSSDEGYSFCCFRRARPIKVTNINRKELNDGPLSKPISKQLPQASKKRRVLPYPKFSFSGKQVLVEGDLIQLIDADTCYICFPVDGVMYSHSVRLIGYDGIESKFKKNDLIAITEADKQLLIDKRDASTKLLSDMVLNQKVRVVLGLPDKYGRALATMYVRTRTQECDLKCDLALLKNVNETMINSKLVFAYGGGTKLTLSE